LPGLRNESWPARGDALALLAAASEPHVSAATASPDARRQRERRRTAPADHCCVIIHPFGMAGVMPAR
jgi:hypothetical protein